MVLLQLAWMTLVITFCVKIRRNLKARLLKVEIFLIEVVLHKAERRLWKILPRLLPQSGMFFDGFRIKNTEEIITSF